MPTAPCGKRTANPTAWEEARFGLDTALEKSGRARSPAQQRNLTQPGVGSAPRFSRLSFSALIFPFLTFP